MATENTGNGSAVAVVAIVVLVLFGIVFFVYGLPALRGGSASSNDTTIEGEIHLPNNVIPGDDGSSGGTSGQ